MNPIVYNKNGQYRFTDFVGYLPEFLQSEPDVVTFMQVLSDYINNAYRNVDVTDEFELIRVCSSTDAKAVMNKMERLADMFRLACDRGEPVMYLSVPRNNINSNVILGNSNAEYAREIEVDLAEIAERIDGASKKVGNSSLADGDVVYVNYRARELHEKVAYYYLSSSDVLVKDSMGTSQDPFTGTYNEPSTAMQFNVTKVGKVLRRYGGVHETGNSRITYYEVTIPIRISEIKRVPATGTVTYDVDSDGLDDMLFVDYYNLSYATSGDTTKTYNTYMKFAGDSGFKWNGEYPSGMFYFKNTSSAKLSRVDDDGTMMLVDTLDVPSVDRYRITKIEKTSGVYRIYTDTFPGLYGNALFYISRVTNGSTESMGVYRMIGEVTKDTRFDSGEIYIDLVNVSGVDYDIEHLDHLVLISIPLAASKYMLDFDGALPVVKWSREIPEPSGAVLGTSSNIKMVSAEVLENQVVYTGPAKKYGTNQISLRSILSDVLTPGDIIRCTYTDDQGVVHDVFHDSANDRATPAKILSLDYQPDTGLYILSIWPVFGIDDVPVTIDGAAFDYDITIYKASRGYVCGPAYQTDMEYVVYGMDTLNADDRLLLSVVDSVTGEPTDVLATISQVENAGKFYQLISFAAPLDIGYMAEVRRVVTSTGKVNAFEYVRIASGNTVVGAVKRRSYSGDIFTPKYMLAGQKDSGVTSLLVMDTDVVPYDSSSPYEVGQYVYDAPYVKKVIQRVEVSDDGVAVNTNSFAIDRVAHYSVGFKEVKNTFVPYYGAVTTLDYDERVNYSGDMSMNRIPMYIKKVNDVRLKYGWNQREYVYYGDDIGVDPMSRAGFVEVYSGNSNSPADIDLTKNAYQMADNGPVMLYGCGSDKYCPVIDSKPTATINNDGSWTVTVVSSGHGLPDGAIVSVAVSGDEPEGCVFEATDVPVTVVSLDVLQYVTHPTESSGLIARIADLDNFSMSYDRSYSNTSSTRPHTYPEENDLVLVDGTLYVVHGGPWTTIDPTAVRTPMTIYSRHNLFDESVTNPAFALGGEYTIQNIVPMEEGVVQLQISGRIPDFEKDADGVDRRVYLQYIHQAGLNGWHTVKTVHNGGIIDIYVDPSIEIDYPVRPITNRYMTVRAGRWYKYTLNGYDWDKKSNKASYVTSNTIMELVTDSPAAVKSNRIKTKYKHNLSIGDSVLIDVNGTFLYDIDSDTTMAELERHVYSSTVTQVPDEYTVVLADSFGSSIVSGSVMKGYIVSEYNVSRISGEYSMRVDGKIVRLRQGDVVVTMAQVCKDEIKAWRVTQNTVWVPLKEKRTFKIDDMSVEMVRNPAYDIGDDFDTESEYRYVTYMDSDVASDADALDIGYWNARNYHFEHPHIENLDTTQNTMLQYSSKYDYATVAPRDGMDLTFHGVPDMGYPLAERIERLAYLRDPDVIDIDLIEYLARFMGYDITALADDIRSSNIYKNSTEQENAIRETIAHLPQFYALSGTKPGINMLMATFGLVGDLVTMWTSTDDPYGKLVRQDEVNKYIDADRANGKTTNSWVPTPHVVLDIIENDNYNSILLGNEELVRMKEQIRRCKPINVVFDGIRVVFDTTIHVEPTITLGGGGHLYDSSLTILSTDPDVDEVEINLDPCMGEDCDF